jgi:hypothetical protein
MTIDQTLRSMLKSSFLFTLIIVQVLFFPSISFAQEVPASDSAAATDSAAPSAETVAAPASPPPANPEPPTNPTNTGPAEPTGASRPAYQYNEQTGLWESDQYTWDPATKQTTPKTPQEYSYNPATGMWDTTEMIYDVVSGTYIPNVVSSKQPPPADYNGLVHNTGPDSQNTVNSASNSSTFFNGFYNVSISNDISSNALSGNASVLQNTNAGGAITGDAQGIVTILNMLQSSWDPAWGDIATFSADIAGNVNGDLNLDISQLGPNSQTSVSDQSKLDLNVVVAGDVDINNDIAVNASSGNALVSGNTSAGDARSGSAMALVNILNFINSQIYAGKSFVGIINITGNFNGDILAPFINGGKTISSTGPNSNTNLSSNNTSTLNANVTNTTDINNNINAEATTGDADVGNNTKAGSATSGQASTNVVLLNLTGKQIVASNALLVFVNVSGQWVGLIMDAPAGTTAAAIGSGATVNANSARTTNVDINATTNNQINNNVTVTANSGDAAVTDNTLAGNAATGDASAGANVLNMVGSELNLSNWFGVLFINVLGNWYGSFGIDTAAGNLAVGNSSSGGPSTGPGVFQFAPSSDPAASPSTGAANVNAQFGGGSAGTINNNSDGVLPAATQPSTIAQGASSPASAAVASTVSSSKGFNLKPNPLAVGSVAAGILLLGGERMVVRFRNKFTI